jgi:hypothetical protein
VGVSAWMAVLVVVGKLNLQALLLGAYYL